MPFQKGHKFSPGSNGQIRRDATIELISQLNDVTVERPVFPALNPLPRRLNTLPLAP
jgi:hypothetical protein